MKKLSMIGVFLLSFFMFPILISLANSTEIHVNTPITGNLPTKETVNTYELTLDEPGRISLSFSHDNLNDTGYKWNVRLYDKNGSNLLTMISSGNSVDLITTRYSAAKGTYYIEVKAYSQNSWSSNYWSDIDYSLLVNYDKNTGNYEIDEETTPINVNKDIIGNLFKSTNTDTYSFNVKTAGRISLNFNHDNLNDDGIKWSIRLYDKNRTNLFDINSRGSDISKKSTNYYITSGTYYVEVTAYSQNSWSSNYWSSIDYTLKVNYTKNKGQFEIEGKTNKLKLNKAITGVLTSSSDTDEFNFTLTKEKKINLIFKHNNLNNTSVYWKVKLINSKGKELLILDVKGDKVTSKSNSIKLPKGKYTVAVVSIGSFYWSNAEYKLTVK